MEEQECEEPRCTRPAKKDWNGRKVCSGCYKRYKEKQENDYLSLPEE